MVKVSAPRSLIDNWDFALMGQSNDPRIPKFKGYVSSIDPTTAGAGVLIGGSQNTYKSLLGTVKNRSGLKRRGDADATAAGVVSSYEWETSGGITRILRATNGKLQVEFDPGTGTQLYDLMTGLTDDEMNLCFSPWYSDLYDNDVLLFVNGKQEINAWRGGIGIVSYAAMDTGIAGNIRRPNYTGNPPTEISVGGIGYIVGDELTLNAGGNNAVLVIDEVTDESAVSTVTINTAGSGYGVGDVVSIDGGGSGNLALLYISTVGGGGAVTGVRVISNGLGYVGGNAFGTTAVHSGGTGLLINITATGSTPSAWHFLNNGTGYSVATDIATTGGTGSGATVSVTTVYSGRITIAGSENLAQLGFPGQMTASDSSGTDIGGTVLINGNSIAFSAWGDDSQSFVGCVINPPTVNINDIAITAVVTTSTTPTSSNAYSRFEQTFTNDWINVIGNQAHIGCYGSRLIHISYDSDLSLVLPGYLDYVVPTFRAPGYADLLTLDSNSRGATAKSGQKGNAVIFGSLGDSYNIVRTQQVYTSADASTAFIYENVAIDKQTSSDLSSPLGQNFIDSVGDTILFLDGNNQLRQYGTLRNLVTPVFPFLSLDVYTEFAATDFAGGQLRAVAEQSGESIYITAPVSGLLYIYQIRYEVDQIGNMRAERLWQPPFVVNASRIAVIDGVTYIYSNVNPQMYQLWDTGQFYDDAPDNTKFPYESHMILAYQSLPNRTQQLYFDKIYFEGYMPRGTQLFCNVYEEYQGAKGIQLLTINNPETPPAVKRARFYDNSNSPELGSVSLGNIPLGQGILGNGDADIPKFRTVRGASGNGVFEYALDVFSNTVDAQWEMLVLGTNMMGTPGRSSQLQKTNL